MRTALSNNLPTSFVVSIAISAMLFGVVGLFNLWFSDNAAMLPAATHVLSISCLLVGIGLIAKVQQQWWLARCIGIAFLVFGALTFADDIASLSIFMPISLCIAGLAFLLSAPSKPSNLLQIAVGIFLLAISALLLLSLWIFNSPWGSTADNPIALTAGIVYLALVSIAFIVSGVYGRQIANTHDISSWATLMASVVMLGTTIIWFLLSNNDIADIKQRGRLNLQQSSEVISQRLGTHMAALTRLVERWQVIDRDSADELVSIDLDSHQQDFELLNALVVYSQPGAELPTDSRQLDDAETDILQRADIRQWRREQFDQQGVVVIQSSLATQEPVFLLSYPVASSSRPPQQLIAIIDLYELLNIDKIQYLDYFNTYLSLSDDLLLPISAEHFYTTSLAKLEQQYPFKLTAELPVLSGDPMKFHAVLSNTGVLWQSATINQFVLIIGFVLAVLLLMLMITNRSLRLESTKLFTMARYDNITPLVRRDVLEKQLHEFLERKQSASCCVLFIDLDGFKAVNDNLGLVVGNRLLEKVAQRLLNIAPEGATVARFSGDEFIYFLPNHSVGDGHKLASAILTAIAQKFDFAGVDLYLTASIGIAEPQASDISAETLIQNADVAMGIAKQDGGNTITLFKQAMGLRYENQLKTRNSIQRAIENEEFEVYYQPYVSASNKNIVGAEALVRWPLPSGEFVSPAEFIPIAEQTGQILPLSELILRRAISDFSALSTATDFTLSINLSIKQLQRSNLVRDVAQLANQYGVNLDQLQFELTEHAMMEDAKTVEQCLAELRTIGCRVAIDDFGTGFSSLAYLSRLPVDTLKIDREFTQSIITDSSSQTVTKGIIGMAHGLDKQLIVEGIETDEQAAFFVRHGCQSLQGFLYYRPMPFAELKQLLND